MIIYGKGSPITTTCPLYTLPRIVRKSAGSSLNVFPVSNLNLLPLFSGLFHLALLFTYQMEQLLKCINQMFRDDFLKMYIFLRVILNCVCFCSSTGYHLRTSFWSLFIICFLCLFPKQKDILYL